MQLRNMKKKDSHRRLNLLAGELTHRDDSFSKGRHPSKRINRGRRPADNHFLERISMFMSHKKILIGLLLVLSLVFHVILAEAIYSLSRTKKPPMDKAEQKTVRFKIRLLERPRPVRKAKPPLPKPRPEKKKKSVKIKGMKKLKTLSSRKLEALGKRYMSLVREGMFPSLTLSYNNPTSYIREMYNLGARTVLFDRLHRKYFEIDLFKRDTRPMSAKDFEGFSSSKRVVKDPQWYPQKLRAATRTNISPKYLQILLLVPLSVEQRWIGHQVDIFRQMNLQISEIETIEARFEGARLKLVRIHLKDGSSRYVNDPGCA